MPCRSSHLAVNIRNRKLKFWSIISYSSFDLKPKCVYQKQNNCTCHSNTFKGHSIWSLNKSPEASGSLVYFLVHSLRHNVCTCCIPQGHKRLLQHLWSKALHLSAYEEIHYRMCTSSMVQRGSRDTNTHQIEMCEIGSSCVKLRVSVKTWNGALLIQSTLCNVLQLHWAYFLSGSHSWICMSL